MQHFEHIGSGLEDAGYATGFVMVMNQPLRYALATAQASYPATREEGVRRLQYSPWMTDIIYVPLTFLWTAQALEAKGLTPITSTPGSDMSFLTEWASCGMIYVP